MIAPKEEHMHGSGRSAFPGALDDDISSSQKNGRVPSFDALPNSVATLPIEVHVAFRKKMLTLLAVQLIAVLLVMTLVACTPLRVGSVIGAVSPDAVSLVAAPTPPPPPPPPSQ
jgi:hypothetical protein